MESNEKSNNFIFTQSYSCICQGKYTFDNKNIFVGRISYCDGVIKFIDGILDTQNEDGIKLSMKIHDGMYYDGEISQNKNINSKYLYLGKNPFSIFIKTKKTKINYLKIKNKITEEIDIEFLDNYCYNFETGNFDLDNGELVIQYVGKIQNEKIGCSGMLQLADGRSYSGSFSLGIFKSGTMISPQGKKYVGNFWNGNQHGIIQVYKNNKTYAAYYLYGKKTPFCEIKNLSQKIKNIFINNKTNETNDDEEMMKLKDE